MDRNEEQRNRILMEAFRADSEIRKLQDQIRSMLQSAVDMDFKRLGYVEKITMDTVDSFNMAIENTRTHRVYPKEYFAQGEKAYSPPDAGTEEKEPDAEKKYIFYSRVDGREKVMEGDDFDELMAEWREIENGRDADSKIGHVDVIHNDPAYPSGYECYRYEIATGKDITPIYLVLPYMGKEELAKTEQYLEENGAKFNSRKEWYVTKDMDLSRFSQYMYHKSPEQEIRKQEAPGPGIREQGIPKQEAPGQGSSGDKGPENAGGKAYYSYAYNKDKSISRFSGSDIREITAHWQKADAGRAADNEIGYFYLKEKNGETGKYGDPMRYETATGKEVTPVYLKLPQMGKNDFARTVQYLKENGAKFNPAKKSWYVTKDMDLKKFGQFLGKEAEPRTSVIGKLDSGKKAAAGHEQNHPEPEKKHGTAR